MAGWTTGDIYTPKGDYKFPDYSGSMKSGGGSETKPKAEDFLKLFGGQISEGLRSRQANTEAARSGSTDGKFSSYGGSTSQAGMNNDLTVVNHPGPSFGPTTIAGTPAKKGFGGVIGRVAGTALGLALAPVTGGSSLALAGLGGGLGGSIGDTYESNRYG